MSENLDLVRSICADWERGEYTSLAWAHPQIEFVIADLPTSSGTWQGVAAMVQAWADFLDAWEAHRVKVDEYRELDHERVLTLGHFEARGRASGVGVQDFSPKGANLFTVRGGKVTGLVIYFDQDRALADLGVEEQAVSQQNVEVVQRVVRRWAEQDPEAALEDIDPAAVLDWSNSEAPDRGVYTGHEAWRAFLQTRDEAFHQRSVDFAEAITPAPDTVVIWGRVREQGRVSGVEVEAGGGAVWTLREGKIVRLKLYQTRAEALKAVGLEE
jgi:ketosteroid isomerase-like protein